MGERMDNSGTTPETEESVEEARAAVLAAWRADRVPGQWPVLADQMAWSW
ncbi:hypothetical protein ACWD25_01755 [Streptomyces sp. NPDC002920]